MILWSAPVLGQICVVVENEEGPLPGAEVKSDDRSTVTDAFGKACLDVDWPVEVEVRAFGYRSKTVTLADGETVRHIELTPVRTGLDPVVVTASRTHLDRREAPVSVQVLGNELLSATQSLSMAEGIAFRPGLRVEYNCQNCGFSQVRLNGLSGPYTQMLIDGRPIFSALSGVYGLEQIPSAMIERVEIVRGGGSSLYGANAIAGTINLITREPVVDEWEVRTQNTWTGGRTPDASIQAHSAWISEKSGTQVWASGRLREPFNANPDALYDRNGDGAAETADDFSEVTRLRSIAGGGRYWYRPTSRSRWEVEARGLYEHRRGGNRFDYEPHEADIAEQLIHRSGGVNTQYEWMNAEGTQRLSAYAASTFTHRDSYYGAGGNDPDSATRARAQLYYGETVDWIANAGVLWSQALGTRHSVISGIDLQFNSVVDQMDGYGRHLNQSVVTPAVYAQWQWKWNEHWTLLTGARYDRPTVSSINSYSGEPAYENTQSFDAFNPRVSLLYKASHHFRLRAGWATGFRAPQAFDEDLHLSTLGGAARIVVLSPELQVEKSASWNAGAEWDVHVGKWEGRIAVDGFYTQLTNPFVDQPFTGAVVENGDTIALLDTKINDDNGAEVFGLNVETEWVNAHWTVQAGWTIQRAQYAESREWYPGEVTSRILRAPNSYGYAILGYIPNERWRFDVSAIFTGSMITPNERTQELVETPFFTDINASIERTWRIKNTELRTELGVYNLLNQYQSDVEVGTERDASYFYGPLRPLSFYIGIALGLG